MNPLIKAIWGDLEPDATVESANVRPSPAPPVEDVEKLDQQIEALLQAHAAEAETAEAEPAVANQ